MKKTIVLVALICTAGLVQAMAPDYKKRMEELAAQAQARKGAEPTLPAEVKPELRGRMEELAARTRARNKEQARKEIKDLFHEDLLLKMRMHGAAIKGDKDEYNRLKDKLDAVNVKIIEKLGTREQARKEVKDLLHEDLLLKMRMHGAAVKGSKDEYQRLKDELDAVNAKLETYGL